jgi:hypothetical protein
VSQRTRSDFKLIRDEARAIELLAEETEVEPHRLEAYWATSADLINVVIEIDELELRNPSATLAEPAMFDLRHRLRALAARFVELAAD